MSKLLGKLAKCRRRLRGISRFVRSRFSENSAVLLYHRVAEDEWDPFQLCVAPRRFAEQLDGLPALGKVLDMGEFIQRQREGRLKKGSLCLTFDDGYVDFFENALPLLEARGLPATIYCVAEGLGLPLWWDQLHDRLASATGSPPVSLECATGRLDLPAGWSLPDAFRQLYAFCKRLPPEERTRQLDSLGAQLSETGDRFQRETGDRFQRETGDRPQRTRDRPQRTAAGSRRLMTAEEIAALAAHPLVTIGAHTLSHSSLAALDPGAQFTEIAGSMRVLSEIANRPVTTFSYPYGVQGRDFDEATVDAVRRAGLDHALAADPGTVASRSDPIALPRLWVHDMDGLAFARGVRRWL